MILGKYIYIKYIFWVEKEAHCQKNITDFKITQKIDNN